VFHLDEKRFSTAIWEASAGATCFATAGLSAAALRILCRYQAGLGRADHRRQDADRPRYIPVDRRSPADQLPRNAHRDQRLP